MKAREYSVEYWDGKDFEAPVDLEKFKKAYINYAEVLLVRKNGRLIAIVTAHFNGWAYEPHVHFLPLVSHRDKLESLFGFLSSLHSGEGIGVVIIKSLESSRVWFEHAVRRGLLKRVGFVEKGDFCGHQFYYSIPGAARHRATEWRNPTRDIQWRCQSWGKYRTRSEWGCAI